MKRIWMGLLLGCSFQSWGEPVTAMTFNVRYPAPQDLNEKSWEVRKDLVVGLINDHKPDFLGSQEIVAEYLPFLEEQLSDYAHIGRFRKGDGDRFDECSKIFYLKDKWELVGDDYGSFQLSETPEVVGSRDWTSMARVTSWGRFRRIGTDETLYVYNTHWDHRTGRDESSLLCADRIATRKEPADPVIFMGDFNRYQKTNPMRHLFGEKVYDQTPPIAMADTDPETQKIDHILVWPNTTHVLESRVLRERFDVGEYTNVRPSDHHPTLAVVDFRSGFNPKEWAERILNDERFDEVERMGRELLATGMSAGGHYKEVWIRDLNTFILPLLDETPQDEVREALLTFFHFQGDDGNIIDGFVSKKKPGESRYKFRFVDSRPELMAHKNTVETDQETSLIQAVCRYVRKTGDVAFLDKTVNGIVVRKRMEMALDYLYTDRWSKEYGLIWGATTADWGDVQPEHEWGVELNENSHLALDIYDNALLLSALTEYLEIVGDNDVWATRKDDLYNAVRNHLWDSNDQKFVPNIYLEDSPFPATFDESAVFNFGGTGVAMEAGLLSRDEVRASYKLMRKLLNESGAPTLGLTVYPVYPEGSFLNPSMVPYGYQNGGDWTWFGARTVRQLAVHGLIEESYRELEPMLDRVLEHDGFYEWWTRDNQPKGSGSFRGAAGVLVEAIGELRRWAQRVERSTSVKRPNVVLILADDLGYGDLSCYGQTEYETPAIDRLAAEGVLATDFYVPVPYCAPSRASLLTGRHPFRTGMTRNPHPGKNDDYGLNPDEITLGEVFQKAGYATSCIGKWHLGHIEKFWPTNQGFDEYYGIPYSNDMIPVQVWDDREVVEDPAEQTLLTRHYTEQAVDFIERNKENPFFLYLPHAMPHKPLAASDAFYTPDTPDDLYADVIRELDWSVGEIFQTLENEDLLENTIFIFMSDNGPHYGGSTGGLKGKKATSWEGGVRVPFIARYPLQLKKGGVVETPIWSLDVFPTVLALAGVDYPEGVRLDGRDITGTLNGGNRRASTIFTAHNEKLISVRSGDWKLFLEKPRYLSKRDLDPDYVDPVWPNGTTITGQQEQPTSMDYPGIVPEAFENDTPLFNVKEDPAEMSDLASAHPEVVERLQEEYERFLESLN